MNRIDSCASTRASAADSLSTSISSSDRESFWHDLSRTLAREISAGSLSDSSVLSIQDIAENYAMIDPRSSDSSGTSGGTECHQEVMNFTEPQFTWR